MGKTNFVFKRTEKKYLLDRQQYESLIEILRPNVRDDEYGRYTICNIYFDTDDYYLIRKSLDKPTYKEKLRLRSYGTARDGDTVFLEIKKKYEGVVYKRRISLTLEEAEAYISGKSHPVDDSQIAKEIDYFFNHYLPKPKMFIAYDRQAFAGIDDEELRVTFDTGIRSREEILTLRMDSFTTPLFEDGTVLMELKTGEAMPLWLAHALSDLKIFPTSFSKYGDIYKQKVKNEEKALDNVVDFRRTKKCLTA
ncbi:MAG: polyphosphate polymerase domain-containing protein [Candidatus Metalachnospira sp.]|nr:polyphosphate polymerase domain-containing protein [Candidatus Metalachnospira sp.]